MTGPLHAGVRPLLQRLHGFDRPASVARIDALAAQAGRPLTGGGWPLAFVPVGDDALAYELRIATSGHVPTREASWHDQFNALVWLTFPRTKAAMNQRHCDEMARAGALATGRGRVRDALTQFDEDGLLLVSDDLPLLDALRRHRWREALWDRRRAVESARLFVFGHALMEKALTPHFGLCAKVRYVDAGQLGTPLAALDDAWIDDWLAGQIAGGRWPASPRELHPLPVLGLPGMTPDNACADYYEDARQFRPLPAARLTE